MKIHRKSDDIITFRSYVRSGDYRDIPFDLAVTSMPDGTLLGMPVVTFGDVTVVFDLEDVISQAYDFAFQKDES